MNSYSIDGANFTDRNAAYDEISRALELEEWFGRNLDALYDVLTGTPGEIKIVNTGAVLNNLGSFGCSLLKTFIDANEDNRHLNITFE